MILGVILRNFKIYKSITYIPISNLNHFCGLIGKNGIGKSSILEALDYYFNNKGAMAKSDWITIDGNVHYFKADGKMAVSETITKWFKKYTFNEYGVLIP